MMDLLDTYLYALIHENNRLYKCSYCNKPFIRKKSADAIFSLFRRNKESLGARPKC